MTRSLTWKLTLAFLLVAATVAGLVAAFLRFSAAGQLDRLIVEQQRSQFLAQVVSYYQANGSWAGAETYLFRTRTQPRPTDGGLPADPDHRFDYKPDRHEFFGLVDAGGVVVIPLLPDYPGGARVPANVLAQGEPVEVDDQRVGTVLTAARSLGLNPEEAAYLERTNTALAYAALGAVLVALVVGVLLARTLTQPLRALTLAAHRMAGGELEQVVTVRSTDEIGELVAAFNEMSRAVARANNARRQMTADVAHDLRTPLTVIAGYVESMRDGELDPTPERLTIIYTEIERLQHLVGDLRTLSQADAGELKLNRQALSPAELLPPLLAAFEHQASQQGVRLQLEQAPEYPRLLGDEARLTQVLANLISNALRYTPAGGQITLSAARADGRVQLTVRDTGQGIAPEDLPLIFNRFYRADQSRTDETGESGLGLAIAKAVVEAHGGTIAAASQPGQGTVFTLDLPAA